MGITGRHGVASALSEAAQIPLLAWVLISQRLASTHLKGAIVNLVVVAVYAATLDVAEDAKDSLYDYLQDAIDTAPSADMLIGAGDWNARPGPADMATWLFERDGSVIPGHFRRLFRL